jgi:hypothetical protein
MAATPQVMDFTNVKDDVEGGFRPRHVPDGDYRAKVTAVDDHTSKTGSKMWLFTIVLEGHARASYPYYVAFEEKQAWKIRNLLIAAGLAVPKKKVRVDPTKLLNKTIGVAMEGEEYNDKMKSVIAATFPASDVQGTPKSSGSKDSSGDVDDADDVDDTADDADLEIEDI